MPTFVRGPPSGEPAVAMRTLYAGRKPPSAIFITRASASVVDARAGLSDGERISCSSTTVEIASSTRRWKSAAAASRARCCAREVGVVGLRDRCLEVQRRLLAALQQRLVASK
jgi:hypothetical protein